MDEITTLLEETIIDDIKSLSGYNEVSEERAKAVDNLVKLHRLRIEELKTVNEQKNKLDEFTERKTDRLINVGIAILSTVGGWIIYDMFDRRAYKYDSEGIIRAPHIRNLITRVLPKK